MIAAAYIRVSSASQSHNMQELAIMRAAEARGDELETWYAETRSARTIDRPELGKVRAAARTGELRRLYVYRLDRLARSGIRDTFEVVEELRDHGCQIVSVADGFDLDGPAAEVVLAVLAWAAKMERLAINERISAAREAAREAGRPWGRPNRCDAVMLAEMHKLNGEGRSRREIARLMDLPVSTVGRAIRATLPDPQTWSREARKSGRKLPVVIL